MFQKRDKLEKEYHKGFDRGQKVGYDQGYSAGYADGYNKGFDDGYKAWIQSNAYQEIISAGNLIQPEMDESTNIIYKNLNK